GSTLIEHLYERQEQGCLILFCSEQIQHLWITQPLRLPVSAATARMPQPFRSNEPSARRRGIPRAHRSPRAAARVPRTGPAGIAGHGLTEPALARLERELVAARRHGYAVNREDTEPGVSAVGVAILLSDGRPLAGRSVAAPVTRLDT